jgi:aerobic C4-dicarboxylate transport protein
MGKLPLCLIVLILACYCAALVFILLLSLVVKVLTGVNAWKFIRYCREEFMLAFGTESSEAVMPRILKKLDNAGCDRAVIGLVVVPTGYNERVRAICFRCLCA